MASLASLSVSPQDGGTDASWFIRWVQVKRHQAGNGHIYYAGMESDGGGAPRFFDGDVSCALATTHCKFITYPPQHTVTGSYTASGTITIKVPVGDVGGAGSLYSVTGLTATETDPSSTGTAIFNVIDSTPPYNVR